MSVMIRRTALLALLAAAACSDSNPAGPVDVVGAYTATSYNGDPIPAVLVPKDETGVGIPLLLASSTLSLNADGTYSGLTCYSYFPNGCGAQRVEFGAYTVNGRDVVTHSADGDTRTFTVARNTLTQTSGNGFDVGARLVYTKE